MRIVYLIATLGHGKGGHFHSLNTIANEIGKANDVFIINIGKTKSSVFKNENLSVHFVKVNRTTIFAGLKQVKELVDTFQADVLHAFDVESYFFARMLRNKAVKGVFLNKCGGPNPKRYYPKTTNLVLFSKENQKYFQEQKRYARTRIHLIPQRVKRVEIDEYRINKFRREHKLGKLHIMRIARIGEHYKSSIIQSIDLLKALINHINGIHLIVLGTVQHERVLSYVVDYIDQLGLDDHVTLCTDDKYTQNASELLGLGDIIVGTGRNFMEASSLNKMLLVPYSESKFPLLVNDENFADVSTTNFSPRTLVENFSEDSNLEKIKAQIGSEQESIKWFKMHFDVKVGAKKYIEAYHRVSKLPFYPIDTLVNYLYLKKHL